MTAPNDRPGGGLAARPGLVKVPTGIRGFDELTGGGLPAGRPTLVCGGAGSGKTLLGLEFLVRGALEFDEPGVLLPSRNGPAIWPHNVASLGFDLPRSRPRAASSSTHVHIDPTEIVGDRRLRPRRAVHPALGRAIDSVGAKRVVLDTIEMLFACWPTRRSSAPSCAGCSVAQGPGRDGGDHRRARRRDARPGSASRSTSPIA